MIDRLSELYDFSYNSIKEMPHGLKGITFYCVAGSSMLLIHLLVRLGIYFINDELVVASDSWIFVSGALIISILLMVSGIAFIKRLKWGRILLLLFIPITMIIPAVTKICNLHMLIESSVIYFLFIFPIGVWYLFFNRSVKNYFN